MDNDWGIGILVGHDARTREEHAALYARVTATTFGPLFTSKHEAEAFLAAWYENINLDLRMMPAEGVRVAVLVWREQLAEKIAGGEVQS